MNRKFLTTVVVTAIALATQASAGFVDITGGYNVLTFGDFELKNGDIEGKLAAGGDVYFSIGYDVYADNNNGDYNLEAIVSGKNVNINASGQVNGSIYAAKDVKVDNGTVKGNIYAENITLKDWDIYGVSYYTNSADVGNKPSEKRNNIPVMVDFDQKYDAAKELSEQLADYSGTTVSKDGSNVLNFADVSGEDVIFYTVDAEDLEGVSSLYFENLNKQYVINVDGKNNDLVLNQINQNNYNKQEDFNFSNVLFNFNNANSLSIGSFYGNILATDIDVMGSNGQMNGCLVAKSFKNADDVGAFEFHSINPGDFDLPPPPPSVPESSTTTMLVAGAIFLLFLSRKNVLVRK